MANSWLLLSCVVPNVKNKVLMSFKPVPYRRSMSCTVLHGRYTLRVLLNMTTFSILQTHFFLDVEIETVAKKTCMIFV